MAATLTRLLAEAAPASPAPSSPSAAPAADSLALATAARLILNAVGESVLKLASPNTSPAGQLNQPDSVACAVSLPEVLRCLLSDDERRILRIVAAARDGRTVASDVQAGSGIEKSTFWPIWSQLQVRGLIAEHGSGKRRYYTLGKEWVRMLLH